MPSSQSESPIDFACLSVRSSTRRSRTVSLDSEAGRRVLELLEELRRTRGLTVLLVTHEADVAERADRIVRMLDGRAAPAVPAYEQDRAPARAAG